jgi:hypothetical protein
MCLENYKHENFRFIIAMVTLHGNTMMCSFIPVYHLRNCRHTGFSMLIVTAKGIPKSNVGCNKNKYLNTDDPEESFRKYFSVGYFCGSWIKRSFKLKF